MSMPKSMTQQLLNSLYLTVETQEEAGAIEDFIIKNYKKYEINLQDAKRVIYVNKGGIDLSTEARVEKTTS